MTNRRFPILFATDSNYIPHVATAINSLLQNNIELKLKIIIITTYISDENKKNIKKLTDIFDTPIEYKILDEKLFDGLVLNYHFKKSNYYRLFAANLIHEERCLYLDADLIVNFCIKDILKIKLNSYYLAAVEDGNFSRHKQLGMNESSKYFNSGVMLINLDKWRSSGLFEKVIDFIKNNSEVIEYVDQCGLNAVIDGNWLELEAKFNVQSFMLSSKFYEDSIDINNSIIHYTGSSKPWHLNNRHPYKNIYWKYRNQTMYKSCISDDFSVINLLHLLTPPSIKRWVNKIRFLGNLK